MKSSPLPVAALITLLCQLALATKPCALERGMFGWRSAEVVGTRPLLAIWVREGDDLPPNETGKYQHYYQDVLFGSVRSAQRTEEDDRFELSVVDYFREVSGGKFTWTTAGFAGPLSGSKGAPAEEIARIALAAAAREQGVDFRAFDANHDGRLTAEELGVLVIAGPPPPGRRAVDFSGNGRAVAIPGQGVAFAGRVAVVAERDGFAVVNRELFRLLAPGAVDIDGWPQKCFALNGGRSLMAATNTADPGLTVHLDPWHKMLVGWTDPRVFAIGKPYTAKLAAQHVSYLAEAELKRPILLYDAMRGPAEFFLLEYRTHSALGFDRALANSGLVVWQVALDGANRPFTVPADRKNCRGETLSVPSLFVRGAPNWQLGGSAAYWGGDGPFSLKWMDGKDSGVRVSVERHEAVDWRIALTWTSVNAAGRN